jgi:hypothetical protein
VHGSEAIGVPDEHLAHVHGMKAVHILVGRDVADHHVGIDVRRQRHLHEDAMHRVVRVEPLDEREQLGLRGGAGRRIVSPCMPACRANFSLLRHVHGAGRIVAHQHHVRPGTTPRVASAAASRARTSRESAPRSPTPSMRSAGKVHRPRLTNDHHLDLPRILEFDSMRRAISSERAHARTSST